MFRRFVRTIFCGPMPFLRACLSAACLTSSCTSHAANLSESSGTISFQNEAATDVVTPFYRRDIVQVLAKAGCNAGACHGNANGKGGFKLSLRGEDPAADWIALTQDQAGRRINLFQPDQSLLLLKATGTLAHEGGRRFDPSSWEYNTLFHWITRGAIDDPTPPPTVVRLDVSPLEQVLIHPLEEPMALRAKAVFSDGTQRDVTHQVVYELSQPTLTISPEGLVTDGNPGETTVLVRYLNAQVPVRIALIPNRPNYAWNGPDPVTIVDSHIFERLRTRRLHVAEICSDELFLRRISLDLLGRVPERVELETFLRDTRPDKRERAVDAWLDHPDFADFWALKWADLLRVEERTLDRKGMEGFHRWIRQAMATNMPMDRFAHEIVSARGSTYLNPPANFYRANRTPVDRGLAVAQVFLGTRLTCAQCHNHPFDRWSQDDYHDWAAVFSKVNYKVLRNDRRDSNDSHEFKGEQIVYLSTSGSVNNPRIQKPATPRFLGESEPVTEPDELSALATWLVRQPSFSQVIVNRIWFHLMGRGLVDPVDDFRATNPASHPELLNALAAEFVNEGHDLRHVIRLICNAYTYQTKSVPHPENYADEMLYSWTVPRRISAEPLLDMHHQVTGVPQDLRGFPKGWRTVQLPGGLSQRRGNKSDSETFLDLFGKPPRLLTCDCERSTDTSMAQAFHLINGSTIHNVIKAPENILAQSGSKEMDTADRIDSLYWTILSRAPAPNEVTAITAHLEQAPDSRHAYEDLLWGLLNSKEFILRH